jgi:hypothetical protein
MPSVPEEPSPDVARIGLVVDDIDTADDVAREWLLEDLLRTAWPTLAAQSQ